MILIYFKRKKRRISKSFAYLTKLINKLESRTKMMLYKYIILLKFLYLMKI